MLVIIIVIETVIQGRSYVAFEFANQLGEATDVGKVAQEPCSVLSRLSTTSNKGTLVGSSS